MATNVTPEETPKVDPLAEATEAMLMVIESLKVVREAVDGYRKQCLDAGYSPDGSERMAIALHDHLLAVMFKGQE
jgi:hypothetical protein